MATATEKQARKEAKKYGIVLEVGTKMRKFEVELLAPDGYRFETDLHYLVNSQWDDDTKEEIWKSALKDIQYYGPNLEKCPDDCSCQEEPKILMKDLSH